MRTTRVVLKFLNPKFAKLQLDYKLNPKFMSDKFPLNEVSPEVIDMSEKVDAENEYRTSGIQYLLNEIWFGVKKAVAFVEKNGSLCHRCPVLLQRVLCGFSALRCCQPPISAGFGWLLGLSVCVCPYE